jgi:hypothetical protein
LVIIHKLDRVFQIVGEEILFSNLNHTRGSISDQIQEERGELVGLEDLGANRRITFEDREKV